VKNIGKVGSGATITKIWLSTDATLGGDTFLGQHDVLALAIGGSQLVKTAVTIPEATAGGSYYIIVEADAGGTETEANETNNTLSKAITISPAPPPPAPDLIEYFLSAPTTAVAGTVINVSDTVKNVGKVGSGATITKIWLSTDATLGGDTFLGQHDVLALAVGGSQLVKTAVTIPEATAGGSYYIIVEADAGGTETEANETNNTLSKAITISPAPPPPAPDLIEYYLNVPSTAVAGAIINVSDTVKNIGKLDAGATITKIWLSTDATLGGDTLLGQRDVIALAVGGSQLVKTPVTIPEATPAGSYYIIVEADGGATEAESNETNNTLSKAITISPAPPPPAPDLIEYYLNTSSSALPGGVISVTDTVKNIGEAAADASTTELFLADSATLGGAVTRSLATHAVAGLSAGGTLQTKTSVTIPADVAPGDYFIVAKANSTGSAPESDSTNNLRSKTFTVSPPPPPDLIEYFLNAPLSAVAGTNINITDTVKNVGTGNAGATTTKLWLSTTPAVGGTLLGTRAVNALAPAQTHQSVPATTVTIPVDTPAGDYFIVAEADANAEATESNETNNTLSKAITITAPTP
jgi:subtilase family serine protease